MRRWIEALVVSNLVICAGATSLFAITYYIFQNQIPAFQSFLLIFGGSMCVYSFHRYIGFIWKADNSSERGRSIYSNRWMIYISGTLGMVCCIMGFASIRTIDWIFYGLGGLLSLGYTLPFLTNRKRLRDLPFAKAFIIAFVWISVCCFPALHWPLEKGAIYYVLEKWFFILGLSLAFDIKDFTLDQELSVKTFAGVKGASYTVHMAIFCVLLSGILLIPQYTVGAISLGVLMSGLTIYFLITILLAQVDLNTPEWYYWFIVDGTIVLQAVAIFFALNRF